MAATKCFLKSLEGNHEPLELQDGKEKIFGRGPLTRIHATRCSRNQIKIVADYEKREAKITQLGRNACGINGMALSKDHSVTVKEGDRIEMLMGQFVYSIEFDPPPSKEASSKRTRKRGKSESSDGEDDANESSGSEQVEMENDDEEEESANEESIEPKSKKARTGRPESGEFADITGDAWQSIDDGQLLVYTHPDVVPSKLIASYDLDGTIITTKSGTVFPKNIDDWKILYPQVLSKLKETHDKKYKIVIFTNQAGLSTGKTTVGQFKSKIEKIVEKVAVPVQVFIATDHSYYRKPLIGMWDALRERNGGLDIDMAESFYCGDAAGREAGPNHPKKDFSQSDLLFAKNLQLPFVTPEHHFLGREMPVLKATAFDPNSIPCDIPLCSPPWGQIIANKTELIVIVGCPGSGKSHFVKTHLIPAGYVHVNRDSLGSWLRCVSVMETALRSKQRVVVDNTNPDVESRRRYITVAKNYTPFVRCFIMNTGFEHAKHNNRFRRLTDPSHSVVSDVVLHTYNSKYREPSVDEGFTEILKINFWPTFKDPKQEKLYKLFLLEK